MLKQIILAGSLLLFFPVGTSILADEHENPAPESEYLGPETVVDISPEEALRDPNIIRINTAGSENVVDACIRKFFEAIHTLP